MKKRAGWILGAVLVLGLSGCGGEKEAPAETAKPAETAAETEKETEKEKETQALTGETLEVPLFSWLYNPDDGWTCEEDDVAGEDDWGRMTLRIPDGVLTASAEVNGSSASSFREKLSDAGIDLRAYADGNCEMTEIGGRDFVVIRNEENAFSCLNRYPESGQTLQVTLEGDVKDPRAETLLAGLTFTLKDGEKKDPPWPWEGTPFTTEDKTAMLGTVSVSSEWIPFDEPELTYEVFEHTGELQGETLYLLSDGVLRSFPFNGESFGAGTVLELSDSYEKMDSLPDGTLLLSSLGRNLTGIRDGETVFSYEGTDKFAAAPDGTWGISYFVSGECRKCVLKDGSLDISDLVFSEISNLSFIGITEHYILAAGRNTELNEQALMVYDHSGNLKQTLKPGEKSVGSITFAAETPSGILALDGNMRRILLWKEDGSFVGGLDDSELFGTGYPWFADGQQLKDGRILVTLTEDRADESAMEVLVYLLSGF